MILIQYFFALCVLSQQDRVMEDLSINFLIQGNGVGSFNFFYFGYNGRSRKIDLKETNVGRSVMLRKRAYFS